MNNQKLIDRKELSDVAEELTKLGYTEASVKREMGVDVDLPPDDYFRMLSSIVFMADKLSSVALLTRTLAAQGTITLEAFGSILSRTAIDALITSGIIRIRGDEIVPLRVILPWKDLLICCDFPSNSNDPDYVFYPDTSCFRILNHFDAEVFPFGSGTALDVGCGCGILAVVFAKSKRFERVIAVDINSKAGEFVSINNALNNVAVEFREGSAADLAQVVPEKIDMLGFALPYLYFSRSATSAAFTSADGDRLLQKVLTYIATGISLNGTAILFHQALTPCREKLLPLAVLSLKSNFQITRISNWIEPIGVQFGVSIVQKVASKEISYKEFEFQIPPLCVDSDVLNKRLATSEILSGPQSELMFSIPRLYRGIEITLTGFVSRGSGFNSIRIGAHSFSREWLNFCERLDGIQNVGDLVAGSDENDQLKTLEVCCEKGIIYLERSRKAVSGSAATTN